jgi:two-component system, cell cycle response regulator
LGISCQEPLYPEAPRPTKSKICDITRVSTILVIDPGAPAREAVERALTPAGYRVVSGEPAELAALLQSEQPSLVIIEPAGQAGQGLEAIRTIKKKSSQDNEFRPVIVVSLRSELASRVDALGAGADDYLVKPFEPRELVARVAAQLRTKRIVDDALKGRSDLEESATHDPLTGLYNQRYLTTRRNSSSSRVVR